MHAARMTRFRSALVLGGFTLLAATLPATAGAVADSATPGSQRVGNVDFERQLMGLFGRMGCNSGSCHGSFQGKGGLRLSLFGYDPEKDYLTLTRDVFGRRLNPVEPERSLLLLKATGQIEHGGGVRFGKDSWQYQLFRDWIVGGARWQRGSGDVAAISVVPPELPFAKAGAAGQLKVQARFADGSQEDITRFCDFRTNDDAIAEVDSTGKVKALRPGDTTIVVSYRGNVLATRVLVPITLPAGFRYPEVSATNYIDREVFAKLRRLNIAPSELSSDQEFLRRVTIDTIGCLPSPGDVRAFLADTDPNKRQKKIEALLDHPMHAALWATKFCDITGNNTDLLENPQNLRIKRSQMWYDWLRKRLEQNMPYDELVRGILCATSRDDLSPQDWLQQVKEIDAQAAKGFETSYAERPSLDLFWRRQARVPIEQWGEKTAAAFMGIRLECAQCHKHPFDRWSQIDYRAYANVFEQVAYGVSPDTKKIVDAENAERRAQQQKNNQLNQVREVYLGTGVKPLVHPDTNRPLAAKALGGPEIKVGSKEDARVTLFNWLRTPDNPFFARSFVNRVWGHYFGTGIVEPVDNFSLANPPSNDKLLDALAQDFVEHNYDIRHLERAVLTSRVYQLSSDTNATNRLDRNNYSHSYVRPLMAEVVVDVLNSALGTTENFATEAPAGSRAIEVGASRVQNANVAYAFRIFGRPPRSAACDCERAMEPALPQKLFLMTDQNVLAKLQVSSGRLQQLLNGKKTGEEFLAAKTADEKGVQQLLNGKKTDEEVLEELFLATLSRFPGAEDKQRFQAYRTTATNRQTAFVDTLWALINTREFILNH